MVDHIDGLLTAAEAAAYVGKSPKTISAAVCRGRRARGIYRKPGAPGEKLVPDAYFGRFPLFKPETLDAYFHIRRKR